LAPDLAQLESALGHHFTVPELLVRALTHRSLANEQAAATEQAAAGWQGAGTAPGPS